MFVVNEDLSIYCTRGDYCEFPVTHQFKQGDVVRFKATRKKDCETVVIQRDFVVEAETDEITITLTGEDTKIGEVISKPTDYWYEVELNPDTHPQTIIGYDEDGAKVFKLFPEGKDVDAEDIEVVGKKTLQELVDYALEQARDSGEFDGDKGDKGDTGNSGVFVGDTEPTDPNVSVWVNTEGEETPCVRYDNQTLTDEQKAQARENIGITNDQNCHAKFFNIDYNGIISLKSQYAKDGSNADELPENIILPEVVNKMAVLGLAEGMFNGDWRVKSITLPSTVEVIPDNFCADAGSLRHVYNTEHITTINYRGFRNSGITKALFPNLKEIGTGVFAQCPLLHIVDIGNEITTIPSATFGNSKFLSCVKGGGSVKTLEASAFQGTRNLTSVPFMSQITSMGNAAFLGSRIQYDWESIKSSWEASKNATPIQDNTTDYWSGYTPEVCENPLTTMLCQKDPRWADTNYGTTTDPYSSGCGVMVALHIHSAITGTEYATPQEFEADIGALPNGATLLANEIGETDALVVLLTALGEVAGYTVTAHTGAITAEVYQNMCEKLNAGAYVAVTTGTSASKPSYGHIVALYGINEYGEVLYLDSDNGNQLVGVYDDFFTGALPFQNFTGPDSDIIIAERV